jgi:hypothetical protein
MRVKEFKFSAKLKRRVYRMESTNINSGRESSLAQLGGMVT